MDTHESTTPQATTQPASAGTPGRSRTPTRRATVVGGAVVTALVVWAVVTPMLGVTLDARSGAAVQHIGAVAVIGASLVAGLLAWATVAVVARRSRERARTTWTVLGSVVLLLSLAGPAGGLTTAAVVGLASLHLAVGLVLVVGLRSTLPGSSGLR